MGLRTAREIGIFDALYAIARRRAAQSPPSEFQAAFVELGAWLRGSGPIAPREALRGDLYGVSRACMTLTEDERARVCRTIMSVWNSPKLPTFRRYDDWTAYWAEQDDTWAAEQQWYLSHPQGDLSDDDFESFVEYAQDHD